MEKVIDALRSVSTPRLDRLIIAIRPGPVEITLYRRGKPSMPCVFSGWIVRYTVSVTLAITLTARRLESLTSLLVAGEPIRPGPDFQSSVARRQRS